ncbi:MAG: polysaccharide biosynthesis/export family protein [Phycisphaerales bacterium]|nr:polysaccharide biosynthesis/export family protein [Phycisphaerales bacterium]
MPSWTTRIVCDRIDWKNMLQRVIATTLILILLLFVSAMMSGCNANAWMGDPTAGGYYKPTPTTIPILDRLDIIEEPSIWPQISKVTEEDLMPWDITYRISPGDSIRVDIYGLYQSQQIHPVERRVDQNGYFRVPEIGDVLAAGLTQQEFQDLLVKEYGKVLMTHPSVQVSITDSTAFTYTMYGDLQRWGVFNIRLPDLHLLDALALAGGVPQTTKHIYVIRSLPISSAVLPTWTKDTVPTGDHSSNTTSEGTHFPAHPIKKPDSSDTSVSIEDLIKQLDIGETPSQEKQKGEKTDEIKSEDSAEEMPSTPSPVKENSEGSISPEPIVSPGILQSSSDELIDIDDLVPARATTKPPVDIDHLMEPTVGHPSDPPAFIYVPERDEWIPIDLGSDKTYRNGEMQTPPAPDKQNPRKVVLERIIEIPWERLSRGDSSYNIVIRPNDRVFVDSPTIGNIYLRGAVTRPGVFQLPATGGLTLARMIAAAGGLSPIAKPEKVSLTRRIGTNLEATVTLNLAAIMQKTEPDIFLRPDDLISVGTDWGSTPMAIIRNGFRSSYGFGFLLDRNFGNDVFGAPPVNIRN